MVIEKLYLWFLYVVFQLQDFDSEKKNIGRFEKKIVINAFVEPKENCVLVKTCTRRMKFEDKISLTPSKNPSVKLALSSSGDVDRQTYKLS